MGIRLDAGAGTPLAFWFGNRDKLGPVNRDLCFSKHVGTTACMHDSEEIIIQSESNRRAVQL